MTCGIYEIVNTVNGKRYVGSAMNIESRWRNHLWQIGLNGHHSILLQRAFDKYGQESFSFYIIRECFQSVLIEEEQKEIDRKSEYNVSKTAGSNEGHRWTEEQKLAHSESKKAYYEGNEDARSKISEGVRKAQSRPEVRLAISEGVKKAHSRPEVKEKLSTNTRSRWEDPEYRKFMTEVSKKTANDPEAQAKSLPYISGKNSKQHNPTIYHFTHEVHGDRICTQWDLRNEFRALKHSNLSQVCSGSKGSHLGWKVKSAP